jgi:catechol 2,3-dioxygenase-like lactoylglutathione lyase family enzyme
MTSTMKLEVVTLPVSDVDRAKRFSQSLGWRLDADIAVGDARRGTRPRPRPGRPLLPGLRLVQRSGRQRMAAPGACGQVTTIISTPTAS